MKALELVPGTTELNLVDREEPGLGGPNDVKLDVIEVGICGTDREQAAGGRAEPPEDRRELVIGHEVFGRVVEVGSRVADVSPGTYGMFTVRRGCGKCDPCLKGRNDLCLSGEFKERGIKKIDGFQTEYVVDDATYFISVPDEIAAIGVLTEPLSISEKAIDEALRIQKARYDFLDVDNWLDGKKVLVAGIGAIGLLAAMTLRLRGARVFGLDVVDEDSIRPHMLMEFAGTYIDGRKIKATDLDEQYGAMDLILEASGIAQLQFDLIDALGTNGIYVMTGIPGGTRPVCILGGDLARQIVLENQIILGSVNAGIEHYRMAVRALQDAHRKWGNRVDGIITERFDVSRYREALADQGPGEIKTVISWKPIDGTRGTT